VITETIPAQAPQTRRKLTPNEVAAIQRPAHTPNEVAAILRLHPVYVRALFTGRKIPGAVRIGSRWILPAPALDRILAEGLSLPSRKEGAR
jgi:hypothetical protein